MPTRRMPTLLYVCRGCRMRARQQFDGYCADCRPRLGTLWRRLLGFRAA